MDTTLEEYAPKYRAIRGLGIVNSSLTFMGFLTQDHREIRDLRRKRMVNALTEAIEKAKSVCEEYGTDLGSAAVQFGLCCEHCADSTLIAMARNVRLHQNLDLYRRRREIDPELVRKLRGILNGLFPWTPKLPVTAGTRSAQK